jgi:hypothetical protein
VGFQIAVVAWGEVFGPGGGVTKKTLL